MKHAHPLIRISLLLACVMPLAMTGCQSAQVTENLTEQYAGNNLDSQMNFWHSLNDKKLISNDEAFHGALLFYCGEDHSKNYDERVWRLKEDGFLPDSFSGADNEAITRGQLAALLAKMVELDGGVMMRIFGPTPRYALKEMVALRIFPTSSSQQVLNGAQYLEIMGRVEDYQINADLKANAEKLDASTQEQAQPTDETKQPTSDENTASNG